MMRRAFAILPVLFLAACGGGEEVRRPNVSYADMPAATGLTYQQFRNLGTHRGADIVTIQKRFVSLDRDNNGVLSSDEFHR